VRRILSRLPRMIGLLFFFLWEVLLANLEVAYDVLTPRHRMRSGVVAVPLDAQTDPEITLLANLITLTPGTLALDVSADKRVLYVHAMYIDDIESIKRDLKNNYERRIMRVMG
jgi:multicomponent Na+:H+ antiporter subunit E